MRYELAKELKDAGFPQLKEILKEDFLVLSEEIKVTDPYEDYEPTLSELIEACGDSFWDVKQQGTNQWESSDANSTHLGKGFTPVEAVAKLWLALNKK